MDLAGRCAVLIVILCLFVSLGGMIDVGQHPKPQVFHTVFRAYETGKQPIYHAVLSPGFVWRPLVSSFWDPYPYWKYGRGQVVTTPFSWDTARYAYEEGVGNLPWIMDPYPYPEYERPDTPILIVDSGLVPGRGRVREVTAYNAGDRNQCDEDPCIDASGDNLCEALAKGNKRCAANFVPLGTRLFIENYGEFLVTDRMHARYPDRVDIAMGPRERASALAFGIQRLRVKIVSP